MGIRFLKWNTGLNKISRAFTLVEISVVVVIIGALTSAIFPRVINIWKEQEI